ncbi:long-chain fatty acid--CoA ligase [Roseivirga sp. E12]|uniref:long-chain fatty acid--CoA ligase n=1 Tax=Roseivirga sp. E12 TaxID=2819237 RepID=UPI001ABC5014|nr:long-chain fatty acid--CoA ligase [Roseivirga sp. E12]MBO3699760.1 long-chain fatty acid--CoA ligase [Roseivirga sp. E12]
MKIEFLLNKFKEKENEPAIVWQNQYYNYNELSNLIRETKEAILTNNVASGEVVALIADYSPRCIAILLTLIELNAIVVPLMRTIGQEEKDSKLAIAGVQHSIFIDPVTDEFTCERLDETGDSHPLYQELKGSDTAGLLLFSSGTSGEPKAALHDFSKLLFKFKTQRKCLRTINFLLFDHWGGLNTLFYTLSNGGIVLTIENRRPEAICGFIKEHKVELLPVSPSFLNLLLLSEAYKSFDLSSLKLITYGTEPMPEHTLRQAKLVFPDVKFLQTYGLIELGVLRSKSKEDDSLWVKLGGEGFDLRIVEGILQIKADSAMLGYLNAPSPFTDDGYFITGDMALEKDGYYKILGRKSEIINVGGEKVYPQEVENVILQLDEVGEVTVFGEKNVIMGNIVSAKVVATKQNIERRDLIKLIKSHCKKTLQSFKVPVKIDISQQSLTGARMKKKRT